MISAELKRVRDASRQRDLAAQDWEAALAAAVQVHTFAEVARVAGVTRQRVAQITGPTGRRPGRGNLIEQGLREQWAQLRADGSTRMSWENYRRCSLRY